MATYLTFLREYRNIGYMSSTKVPHGLSALLSFTAENVRSFRDEVHISFLGTRLAEEGVAHRLAVRGTEKTDGVSYLYPLADFGPRQDEALGRRYLQGRYGGVPFLNPADIHRWSHWLSPLLRESAAIELVDHTPANIKQAVVKD